MARKTRIEYAGACYHILNRGNYRSWIFETDGARKSFLKCLNEVCISMDWRLYSWCLMDNHYHLCLQTLEPNLVEGMRWFQSTFANRFNRFRGVNGHVFQGRYKAILLDTGAIGPVSHYIHLNPVRAGLVEPSALEQYSHSSFAHIWYPRQRWIYETPELVLELAGGLADTPVGRRKYREYLQWLGTTDEEQKRLGFESMCRGWIKGTQDFKDSILEEVTDKQIEKVVESEVSEMREPRWERTLHTALQVLKRNGKDLDSDRKGSSWKVDIARYLRETHLVPYRWIAKELKMGSPSYVQSLVSHQRKTKPTREWTLLKKHGKLD